MNAIQCTISVSVSIGFLAATGLCPQTATLHIRFFAESFSLEFFDSLLALAIFLRRMDGSKKEVWAIITKHVHALEEAADNP